MNAIGYLRCSGFGNGTDTWERQLETIRGFCLRHDLQLIRYYQEDAVPGKLDREDRPAFQKMIAEIGDCKTIIIERLDRLARRYATQESLITYIASQELTLIAADTGEDVTEAMMGDPMRRALVQIQGIFAELDKNMVIAKLRKARERLREKNGKCEGRKSFGYRPEEKDALEFILTNYDQGQSPAAIANALDALKIPTRYGKLWNSGTVWKILNRHERSKKCA
jgi:DNA invertase Pin-like site-specific DNA recombinase